MTRRGRIDLLRGTLDMLVLQVLEQAPSHGYAIAKRIQQTTDEVLSVEEGSLYPALYRMEKRGLIESAWGVTETNRRAKIYRMKKAGLDHLAAKVADWGQFSAAVGKLLQPH